MLFRSFSLPTHALKWAPSSPSLPRTDLRPPTSGYQWDPSGCFSDPSWFGFMLRVRPEAKFTSRDLARHLDENGVGNRMLFGGNLTKQPVFSELGKERPGAFRVIGSLTGADDLMKGALFLGVFPGLRVADLKRIVNVIEQRSGQKN